MGASRRRIALFWPSSYGRLHLDALDDLHAADEVVRGEETVAPGNLWPVENPLSMVKILDAALGARRKDSVVE
jgi:hypothetical protein